MVYNRMQWRHVYAGQCKSNWQNLRNIQTYLSRTSFVAILHEELSRRFDTFTNLPGLLPMGQLSNHWTSLLCLQWKLFFSVFFFIRTFCDITIIYAYIFCLNGRPTPRTSLNRFLYNCIVRHRKTRVRQICLHEATGSNRKLYRSYFVAHRFYLTAWNRRLSVIPCTFLNNNEEKSTFSNITRTKIVVLLVFFCISV